MDTGIHQHSLQHTLAVLSHMKLRTCCVSAAPHTTHLQARCPSLHAAADHCQWAPAGEAPTTPRTHSAILSTSRDATNILPAMRPTEKPSLSHTTNQTQQCQMITAQPPHITHLPVQCPSLHAAASRCQWAPAGVVPAPCAIKMHRQACHSQLLPCLLQPPWHFQQCSQQTSHHFSHQPTQQCRVITARPRTC
jgi:hypothetical protein